MKNKVVLITGGTSGLGAATAKAFASQGSTVIFCGRRDEEGAKVEKEIIDSGGNALFIKADVTDEKQVSYLVEETIKRYGRLDVALNNAGANLYFGPIEDMSSDDFMKNIMLNLTGVFYALKFEILAMKQSGGSIINTSSTAGVRGVRQGLAAYVAAKHGVIGLTKAAALEHAHNQIRVNALVIGAMATEQWLRGVEKTPGMYDKIAATVPLGKVSTPEDIIPVITFLASNEAKFITGSVLTVDGGVTTA